MKAEPMVCPVCRGTENYYGRLVFPQELPPTPEMWDAVAASGGSIEDRPAPSCPNHSPDQPPVLLRPVNTETEQKA